MFADLLPAPTYLNDWYMVGWPASVIVPLTLTASFIALGFVTIRRGRPVRNGLIIATCLFFFVAADYAAYKIGCSFQSLWRQPHPPRNVDLEPQPESVTRPSE